MAKIGDILECIDDDFSCEVLIELVKNAKGHPLMFPVKGENYLVKEVFTNEVISEESYILYKILRENTIIDMVNPKYIIPLTNELRTLSFANWRFKLKYNEKV